MLLSNVLQGLDNTPIKTESYGPNPAVFEIEGISYNSAEIQPNWLFIAIPGRKLDGHNYIADALARGAVAIAGSMEYAALILPDTVPYVRLSNPRQAMGYLACQINGQPSRRMGVIGVTGTDGKTTTTNLIAAILDEAGFITGLTSTVDFKVGQQRIENATRFTNLEAPELQILLRQMAENGVQYAVVESTSSGLELDRLTGIEYDIAVVTNITSEHLEVHGTKERYWQAKALLFDRIDPTHAKYPGPGFDVPRICVLNADDASYAFLSEHCHSPIVRYGIDNPGARVDAKNLDLRANGSSFDVQLPNGEYIHIETPLVARFNVANCVAAIAAVYHLGISPHVIAAALARFPGVPGRMERIDEGQAFTVIVDYAHTAESLRQVLTVLHPLTKGRLIAVFGSAGDRDTLKRPEMGAVAAEYADWFVITDEDPRTEDAGEILEQIARGAEHAGAVRERDFICQVGRRDGIARAFAEAQPDDTVVLCGKGHEQSIFIGKEKVPWDDRLVARELLANIQR